MTLIVPCSACLARDDGCKVCGGSGIERDEPELPFESALRLKADVDGKESAQ